MILNKTDVKCLQAYKHRVLEGPSYKPLQLVYLTLYESLKKGHDSHHNTLSRLAAFAKLTYRSDRNNEVAIFTGP